ncbi:MAG: hypothetical protein WBB64_13235 [Anaerolineales bacterium]
MNEPYKISETPTERMSVREIIEEYKVIRGMLKEESRWTGGYLQRLPKTLF